MSCAADQKRARCERALELHDKGLTHAVIAQRLGMKPDSVRKAIDRGMAEREQQEPAR